MRVEGLESPAEDSDVTFHGSKVEDFGFGVLGKVGLTPPAKP